MKRPIFGWPRWVPFFLAAVGVGILVFVFTFFPRAGSYLAIKTAEPAHRDIIVILGGGWNERIDEGEELLSRGYASQVLLTGVSPIRDADKAPLDPRYSYLLAAGVTEDRIYLDNTAQNTWQEAHVIRNLLQDKGWHTVLIVTDPPHLRRLAWVCNQVLSKAGIDYTLVPTHPLWWDEAHWWRNGTSRWFVVREFLKLLAYRLLYF